MKRVAYCRRVVANLTDGSSIEGVLWQEMRDVLVLRDAHYLEPGADPVQLDGDTIVPLSRILFVQAP